MGMDFVVVLDPSVDEPERRFGVRHCCDADIVPLQGFSKASDMSLNCGLAKGVKQGVRLSAWANSLVSLAV